MKSSKYPLMKIAAVALFSISSYTMGYGVEAETASACSLLPAAVSAEEDEEPKASYRKLNFEEEKEWISELQAIEIPRDSEKGYRGKADLNVYYKYAQPVDGYTVTCRFLPYGDVSETGFLIANFQSADNHFVFTYQVKTNLHLLSIMNWQDGDVYAFDYIPPTTNARWKTGYEDSPLGYYTPFQFFDIDFDGEKELLVNDFDRSCGGNHYFAYKVGKNQVKELPARPPFSYLYNSLNINTANKSITVDIDDGASYSYRFLFVSQKKSAHYLKTLPDFRSDITKDVVREYMKGPSTFALDSVREHVGDSVYLYHRVKNRLER